MAGSGRKIRRNYGLSNLSLELQRLFFDRTEAAAYFRDKCVKQEEELEEIQLDFDARIKNVRGFWRDKVYHEHSRGEKLLKLSMQS